MAIVRKIHKNCRPSREARIKNPPVGWIFLLLLKQILKLCQAAKEKRRMRATEILDDDDGEFLGDDDMSNDGCAAEA